MELESVCGVTMGDFGLEVGGEVDDSNGFEWAPFCTSHLNDNRKCGRKTHFFTQIPQPMHKNSEMNAILSEGLTSMQSLPVPRDETTP